MRILLVAVLLASCADDGVRHTPDATHEGDAAIDASTDAALAPAMLSGSPGATAFGDVVLGQSTAKVTYTISNDGDQASGTLGVLLDSSTAGFSISDNHCSGISLASHETCTFAVSFQPAVAGLAMTTVHAAASPGGDVARDLTGNGLQPGAIDVIEASHDFLSLAVDAAQPATHTFTVKNTGQVPTGVPMPEITGTVDSYSIASTTCTAALAPLATCAVVVHFDPITVGMKPGALVVTATPGGSDSATVAGTGFAHVAVARTGNGGGTVTSSLAGISCGSGCAADFTTTPVALTAAPSTGSVFAGWTGDCSGTVSCSLDLTAGKAVTAAFNLQQLALTTATAGTGAGTITGAGTYNYGTQVSVTATPATGSTFAGFSGACSGMGPCTVTMTQARSVTATFTLNQLALTTATAGNGSGTVTGAGTYDYGTQVTVTATPATGSTFTGFSGACTGTGPCVVTMTQAQSVTATFTLQRFTLTTSKTGTGNGTITGAGTYNYGTQVTVTESPATGSTFTGWGGDCAGTGACVVTMTQARSVSAQFTLQQLTLTTATAGNGSGTITGAGTYDYGTQVTVTASPAASSTFTGFSGACTGTGPCTVTMTQARSVTATFTLKQFTLTTSTSGAGSGTITGAGTYNYGTQVAVTAFPATGSTFGGYSGDCTGPGPCVVTMTQARSVTATFDVQMLTLTTATAGTGSGTISGAGTYAYGTQVTVTESPATGSTFGGYSGDCTGSGPCTVTMTQARSVTATFTAIPETLTVTTAAPGGTITSSPAGINCTASSCAHDFNYGTLVKLVATPDPGHAVGVVAGDCTSLPCTVTMDQARSVTVRFVPLQYTFDLSFLGDSTGTVTINGTAYTANTSFTVAYGQQLNLTATPPAGSGAIFYTWGGACSGNSPTCTLTVAGDTSVSATFLQGTHRYILNATTQSPNGIAFQVTYPTSATTTAECTSNPAGQNCAGSLPSGTVVTLLAHLPIGTAFQPVWNNLPTWTGCDSVSADQLQCTFTSTSMRTIKVIGDVRVGP